MSILGKKVCAKATSGDMLKIIDYALNHIDEAQHYDDDSLTYYKDKVALQINYLDVGIANSVGREAAAKLREIMRESVGKHHEPDSKEPKFKHLSAWGLDTHIMRIPSHDSCRFRGPSKEKLVAVLSGMREIVTQRAGEIDAPGARKL